MTQAAAIGHGVEPGAQLAQIFTFLQPDRARDRDNLLAACKPMLDDVADALGVNDSQFEPVTIRREYGKKPGAVRVHITPGPDGGLLAPGPAVVGRASS